VYFWKERKKERRSGDEKQIIKHKISITKDSFLRTPPLTTKLTSNAIRFININTIHNAVARVICLIQYNGLCFDGDDDDEPSTVLNDPTEVSSSLSSSAKESIVSVGRNASKEGPLSSTFFDLAFIAAASRCSRCFNSSNPERFGSRKVIAIRIE
jgi:hypothetical protein